MPLCTAISEDGATVALVTSPHIVGSRLTVPLYQVSSSSGTSNLQSTLAASISSYGLSNENEDGDPQQTTLTQLCFASQDKLLCALVNHKVALVWDISRGVVAYPIQHEDDDSTILNVHGTANHVYALVLSSPDNKLCVHQYEATTGKLVKKLKCGKLSQDSGGDDTAAVATSCCMAVTSDGTTVAIRNGNLVRLYQLDDGSKCGKCKLKENGTSSSGRAIVTFSNDNTLVATSTGSGIMIFTVKTQKAVGTIYVEGGDSSCDNLALSKKGDSVYNIIVQASSSSLGALYSLDLSKASKKTVLKPHTKVSPKEGGGEKVVLSLLSSSMQPTVVAAMYDYQRRLVHLQNINEESGEDLKLSFPEDESNAEDDTNDPSSAQVNAVKKRKSTKSISTVLGPGQAGGEALQITDRPASKRAKISDDEDDFDDDDDEDGDGEKEQSIAERLQRLAQEMQESDDDEEEEEESGVATKIDFNPKKATTESLSHLLKQALTSGDDTMLELALGVRNKGILQVTLSALEASHIALLLTKLTSRLASKPTRADELSLWLRFVLMSEKLQSVVASGGTSDLNLRPLHNLLQERTESFPHLLRLEGRLSLMGHNS
mmetsp:Transcript_7847/g.11291  ORF Transcript_7847/g.11291 Transcript_7847/m.11291 type:complete len:603 (+) Transcript_7847:102-1910(+)